MLASPSKKNKISLSDYNYQRDIDNRLLMAEFSTFDVKVLEEVLNSSIKIPFHFFAKNFNAPIDKILSSLEILSKIGLLKLEKDTIIVSKEMRKYYEFQILKFSDTFRPNVEFLQALLKKVPIHALPNWYSLPRTSDNIFKSIIEKYLLTPKIFQNYLSELNFDDPILTNIVEDIHNAPDFKVRSRDLREKYNLSREKFEIYMLHLEFNFLGFLSYNRLGDEWKEVVSPLEEWCEYQRFRKKASPSPIEKINQTISYRPPSFAFIRDMESLLQASIKTPLPIERKAHYSKQTLQTFAKHCSPPIQDEELSSFYKKYLCQLIDKLCEIQLAEIKDCHFSASSKAQEWLNMPLEDKAIYLLRHPKNFKLSQDVSPDLRTDRNNRLIEKSLSSIKHNKWLVFEDFLKGMICPIGETPGTTLIKKGRKWKYSIPQYSPDEKAFIKLIIFERLYQIGITEIGTYLGKDCFRITDFGLST